MVILFLSTFSPLIPLVVGFRYRFTLLWLYVLTGFCFELLIYSLRYRLHLNYYWADNLFLLSEFLFIATFYRRRVFNNNIVFTLAALALAAYFCVSTLLQKGGYMAVNELGASFFYFSYIICSITGFYKMLQTKKDVYIEKQSLFWVNTAFLVLGTGTFFILLFMPYFRQVDIGLLRKLWSNFFLVINMSSQVCLAIALSKKTLD